MSFCRRRLAGLPRAEEGADFEFLERLAELLIRVHHDGAVQLDGLS